MQALRITILGLLFAAIVGMAGFYHGTVLADEPSDVESAVIGCNDANPLGHGGSADNPPECNDPQPKMIDTIVNVSDGVATETVASNCKPRVYMRDRVVVDRIDGEVVGEYNYTETIVLSDCPVSAAGENIIKYGGWAKH